MDNGVMLSGHAPSVPQYNGRGQPQSSEGQMYPKRNSSTASSSYSTSEQQPYSSNNYSPTSQGASFSNMAIAAVGANAIRIKAAFNGNVFISSIEYNYTLEELVDHIQSICGIQPVAPHEKNDSASFPHLAGDVDTSSCTIKWIDEDGDPCTIESDHELKEALRQFHVNKDNEIRLYVFASKPNRPGEPCEGEVKDIYRRGARRWRRLYKINGHSFAAKRFGKRALCFICRDVIWGLGRQGFRCIECKIMVHKKCHKRVSFTCGESYDTITRSLPTQKRETEDLSGSFMASTTGRPTTAGKQNGSSSASASLVPPAGTPSKRGGAVGDVADGALLHTPQHHLKVSSIGGSPTPVPEAKTSSSSSAFCISLADFHLLKVIGRGSFAKVLLAEYRNTGKKYAMKVIKKESIHDDEDIDCVQTEKNVFEIATNHPFLVGLHSCFQTPSRLIFVIEFVSGGDLMFHMQRQKKLPEEHGRFYAAEICSALHFLHDKGIIYRDLKLDNVLLDNEGHVKLTDYGMCKENMGYYDTTGTFCGTPNYIAPELLTGGEYGFSVDWWALGVLTYEMLAGRSPFDLLNVDNVQNTEEYLFQIILQKPIRIPRSLSPKASAVLKGFLNKNPTDRLGCDPAEGFAHIQNHPFFRPIDWEKLERKQIEPPFKPTVEDDYEDYLNNFDTQFTDEPVQFTPDKTTGSTDTIDQSEFEGFDYVNPLLMSSEDNV